MQTQVDRLLKLFSTKTEVVDPRKNSNEWKKKIRDRGARNLATALGISESVVSRWNTPGPRGCNGKVPPQYNWPIIQAADHLGISRDLLAPILAGQCCPACGQPIEPGTIVTMRKNSHI